MAKKQTGEYGKAYLLLAEKKAKKQYHLNKIK